MTSDDTDRAGTPRDQAAQLLADMRSSVETAASRLDALTDELAGCRLQVDVLETVVDALLELGDLAVVVIDGDRRIIGLGRSASERFDGAAVGKPLSAVVPAGDADDLLDAAARGVHGDVQLGSDGSAVRVHPLPGGGALLVFPER